MGPPIKHTECVQVLGYLAGGPWLPGQAAPAAQLREQRFINVVKHASTHTPGHTARLQCVLLAPQSSRMRDQKYMALSTHSNGLAGAECSISQLCGSIAAGCPGIVLPGS